MSARRSTCMTRCTWRATARWWIPGRWPPAASCNSVRHAEEQGMQQTRDFLERMGLPGSDRHDLPTSAKRFPDGAQYRIEIPSTEGPGCLRAVLEEADRYGITIHRVSQGSGVFLQTDEEILEMAELCRERAMEVSLFARPHAGWGTSALALAAAGKAVAARSKGQDQLVYGIEDVKHACALGI